MNPKDGEVWHWRKDGSRCDEIYGPGICLGSREGYGDSEQTFITFQFSEKGVMNIPLKMVQKFMYRITWKI